jgi:hypothetical protein
MAIVVEIMQGIVKLKFIRYKKQKIMRELLKMFTSDEDGNKFTQRDYLYAAVITLSLVVIAFI